MLKRYLFSLYRWLSGLNFWFRRRFSPAGMLVLCGLVASGLVGLDTNFTIAYQIFWLLLCLLTISIAYGVFTRARFSVERQLPRFGTVGVALKYAAILSSHTPRIQRDLRLHEAGPDPRPTLRQFLDTPEPGERNRNWFDRLGGHYRWRWLIQRNTAFEAEPVFVDSVSENGSARVELSFVAQRRGLLQLPALLVSWPDPFGLFYASHRIACPQSVLVLPKRFPVSPLSLPGTTRYQPGGISLASSVGQSEEFVSLREYRPGDPLRHIHWRSWAKTDKPIVKEFLDEFFVRHALVLDTFCDEAQEAVFEDAVSVAASFACTIPDQESLLDLMFVGPEAYCFTSGRGVAPPERMLEILAAVSPCTAHSFAALERLLLRHVAQLTSCVCIFLEWDEPRRALVRQLRFLGVPVQVYVIRSEERAGEMLEPGPLMESPHCLRAIAAGKITEAFACK
jgi:hypothetical protein